MNRRGFLAGGATALGGLAGTALSTGSPWDATGSSFRVGLSTLVPVQFRADDRCEVTAQLRTRCSQTELLVDRADEWRLLGGLAGEQYDIVELGAVAGQMAVETGLAIPLVQPQLADGWQYEGQLLVGDQDQWNQPTGHEVVVGGSPLSTSTHAALVVLRERMDTVPRVCWHRFPTGSPSVDSPMDVGVASDEFWSPPEASVDCTYPIPVPALYVRTGFSDIDEIRERCLTVRGGRTWFGEVRDAVDAELAPLWLDNTSFSITD